jgi:YidC/Oxa1 family membrane protein insertase
VSIPFLNPLYDAVAWVIMQLHAGLGAIFGPSSGWAWALTIVLLVVLMRLLLVPLFIKQMHATRKMTALAPQVAELKKKYKNDRQKLNEETMKLYRENGANPLAGCLPLVAQLPVFFALFAVLRAISLDEPKYGLTPAVVHSAQHASIFGATVADRFLSTLFPPTLYRHVGVGPAQWAVIFVFVVISATTTFMTVRQSMKRGMTPQVDPDNPMASSQKMMQYIVPVFALSGLYWQFGLVLYWVTTNLWTLGQQYVLFKRFPPPAVAGAPGGAAAPGGGRAGGKQAAQTQARSSANVTAAGRAAARQRAAAKAAATPDAATPDATGQDGSSAPGQQAATTAPAARAAAKGQPGKGPGQPAKPAAGAARPPINQLRKPAAKQPATAPAKPAGRSAKPAPAPAPGNAPGKPAGSGKPAEPAATSNGKTAANGTTSGNPLRRLVRGRGEPEAAPEAEPETRIVRQQPVRQTRSRRSGKR